jgi:hypothetical protein
MGKEYYVYMLLDTRKPGKWCYQNKNFDYEPFYIGKGKNKRFNEHFRPSALKQQTLKSRIINRIIIDTNDKPIIVKVFENLTEEESFINEIELINFFGRIDKGTGVLANHTDGGEGHSGCNKPKLFKRKEIFQYSLNGELIQKWDFITEAANSLGILSGNISTAIKRKGTCGGFLWSYEENNFEPKIKYQMPIKYTNIKQIDLVTNEIINIFDNALEIEKELNLPEGGRNKIYECLTKKIKKAYGYKWEK